MATLPKQATVYEKDEQVIHAIPEEFTRYYEARNVDKLLELFADDGCQMPPFHPIAQGKTALRQSFEQSFKEYEPKGLQVTTTLVDVFGDLAFSIGTFKLNLKLPAGKRIDDVGKWIVTLRRVSNTWKMVAHCWNSDLPIETLVR